MNENRNYSFEGFELDTDRKVLLRSGEIVPLRQKAVETLIALVRRKGEIVSKEELIAEVWPDTFVEENSLSRNIHEIRKLLRDASGLEKQIIQTVPKTGYRFVAELSESPSLNGHDRAETVGNGSSDQPPRRKGTRWAFAAIVLIPLLFVAAFAIWTELGNPNPGAAGSIAERKIKSVAVLPIKRVGSVPDAELVVLGLTDTLIGRLGSLNKFVIRPYSAVVQYADTTDVVGAGKELGVDAVVEGTLQVSGDRYKVSLKLIDVRDGAMLWSENFDETVSDIFRLQDVLSLRAADSLAAGLTEAERRRIVKNSTNSSEAYFLYLKGKELWLRRSGGEEIPFFRQAIRKDPQFALAYLGLADSLVFAQDPAPAEEALAKALQLDPELEGALATRGFIQMFHRWDWKGAERSLKRSIELFPYSAKSHHWYGVYLGLQGDFDGSEEQFKKALDIDPSSFGIRADLIQLEAFRGNHEAAERSLKELLREDPGNPLIGSYLSGVQFATRPDSEIVRMIRAFVDRKRTEGEDSIGGRRLIELERTISSSDQTAIRKAFRDTVISQLMAEDREHFRIASYLEVLGQEEEAMKWLERGVVKRSFLMPIALVHTGFENLRDKPRFREVARKINPDILAHYDSDRAL